MYFSKNSRYVFHKVHWLPQSSYFFTCLKRNDKNLSIKSPDEDPTKPPLRFNIPKESEGTKASYPKIFQDSSNIKGKDFTFKPRSKSVLSRSQISALSPSIEENFLPKCESETEFSNINENNLLLVGNIEKDISEEENLQKVFSSNNSQTLRHEYQNIDNFAVINTFDEKPKSEIYENNLPIENSNVQKNENSKNKTQESTDINQSEKNSDVDKNLYFLVDLPDKRGEIVAYVGNADCFKEGKKINPLSLQEDFSEVKSLSSEAQASKNHEAKMDWQSYKFSPNNSFKERSRSLPKLSKNKLKSVRQPSKSNSESRFEVHEMDDAFTNIFRLKFRKNLQERSFSVGRVPEKEINTRNESFSLNDSSTCVQETTAGKNYKGSVKEMTPIKDLPEPVKYAYSKNKQKKCVIKMRKKENIDEKKDNSQSFSMTSNSLPSPSLVKEISDELTSKNNEEELNNTSYLTLKESNPQIAKEYENSMIGESTCESNQKSEWNVFDESATDFMSSKEKQKNADISNNYCVTSEVDDKNKNSKAEANDKYTVYNCNNNLKQHNISTFSNNSEIEYFEYNPQTTPKTKEKEIFELKSIEKKKLLKKFNTGSYVDKKKRKIGNYRESQFHSDSKTALISSNAKYEKIEPDITDFQSSSNTINISHENISKFCAAFPPTLSEALMSKGRNLGFKKDSLFNRKWSSKTNFGSKDFEMNPKCVKTNKVTNFSENSILFPIKEKEKCNCDSLISSNKDIILNVAKNTEKNSPKMTDSMVNMANTNLTESKEKASVDSLTMMKKVKEIIDFDLNNAIKIFDGREQESNKKISSVLILNDDIWKVNNHELEKCIEFQKTEINKEINLAITEVEEKTTSMKLGDDQSDSIVFYYPKINKFAVNKKELESVIHQRKTEGIKDLQIIPQAEKLKKEFSESYSLVAFDTIPDAFYKKYEIKSGDSVLVFDEENQIWKVDFSILPKKDEKIREEEKLKQRSEQILETIEKQEQEQLLNIPKPDSREKKIFDYNAKVWKIYEPEKGTTNSPLKQKPGKTKFPSKESDAEEIRKKNSDLYEDLFVVKKKEIKMNKKEKEVLELDSPNTKKNGCSYNLNKNEGINTIEMKKESGTTTNETKPASNHAEKPFEKSDAIKLSGLINEDDNFWGTFLQMDILPRSIADIPEIKIPPPSQPPPSPIKVPKQIEEVPKTKTPFKKIGELTSRLSIPFKGDKKNENSKKKSSPPSKEKINPEVPKMKSAPPTNSEVKKIEEFNAKFLAPNISQLKNEKVKEGFDSEATEVPKIESQPLPNDPKIIKSSKSKPNFMDAKTDKSVADHYISDNIVEISKSTTKNSKVKSNKIETVKLNVTSDKRMPSKITEINLNKKTEVKVKDTEIGSKKKDSNGNGKSMGESSKKNEKNSTENKIFYKNFEKYKTPFSDPEYEEKSRKIKSDLESNPNLKKLDGWNKTLVLHDIMKPPENIESWLKDETDKMATLLLKVLQEAADAKPKKKPMAEKSKSCVKTANKENPYDNIRKKQENNSENFFFKLQTVNIGLENDKKLLEQKKLCQESEPMFKNISSQSTKSVRELNNINAAKVFEGIEKDPLPPVISAKDFKISQIQTQKVLDEAKTKLSEAALEVVDSCTQRDVFYQNKMAYELTEDIPGPQLLKKIFNIWKMLNVINCQMTIFSLIKIFQLVNVGISFFDYENRDKSRRLVFDKFFTKYGPVVNLQGPLSGNVVLIHKPEHLTAVFEQDATFFAHSVFDSLEQCRQNAEEKVHSNVILTDWNKPEWNDLKKALNDPLMKGYSKFFEAVKFAGESLIFTIRQKRNGQNYVSEDFMEEIKRWSMEGLCIVLFGKSFDFLKARSNNMNWILEPEKFYMILEKATDHLSKCERGFQMWRLMVTPSLLGLSQAYQDLSTILAKQLYQAELNLKKKNELFKDGILNTTRDLTFVESMLLNDGMTLNEVNCNLIDILLIGINSMSSTFGFLLYNLAQNIKVQSKLLAELKEFLPEKNSHLNYQTLYSLKYLQACVKETLRLHLPIPVFYKALQNDVLLSNYIVPKGTYIVMNSKIFFMKEQVFDEPEKFTPERWLTEEKWMQDLHPFASFPFCQGPRAELAKRVIEMQLYSCAAKVVRNFQIDYHFGKINETETIISFPDKPLKLNFIERDN